MPINHTLAEKKFLPNFASAFGNETTHKKLTHIDILDSTTTSAAAMRRRRRELGRGGRAVKSIGGSERINKIKSYNEEFDPGSG